MGWWNQLSAYAMFLGDTPALAADMALRGPEGDHGFYLANSMQRTAAPLDVYPALGVDTAPAGA